MLPSSESAALQGGSAASGVGHGVRAHAVTPTSPHQRPLGVGRAVIACDPLGLLGIVCVPIARRRCCIRMRFAYSCTQSGVCAVRRGTGFDAGTATVCARRRPQSPGRRQLGHGHGPLRPPLTRTRSSRLLVWACHCQSRWPPSELTRTRKSAGPRVARPLWARPARWRVSRSSRNHGSRFAPAK